MKNKLLAWLLCAGLMLMLFPQAAQAADDYTYLDENGDAKTAASVTSVVADMTILEAGWYVVNSDVTCNTTLTVSGDAKLILTDGSTLTVMGSSDNAGINVSPGNSLTIYGQIGGTGSVIAQGGANGAGIGGGKAQSSGSIAINGGTVIATGGTGGAGIGGGAGGTGSNGGDGFYGTIGGTGGAGGAAGTVTISGGMITANGSNGGAGIGGGVGGTGGKGGSWTSGYNGGQGGSGGDGGTLIIRGGTVNVSGSGRVKIGGGSGGAGGKGGFRAASGGDGGRGGKGGSGGTVMISGGTVTPTGSGTGTGIGGGVGGAGGTGGEGRSGMSSGFGPSGAIGTASGMSGAVINGGTVNAEIGCIPTNGGGIPVYVYPTVVCLSDAVEKNISVLSVSQNSNSVSYGINDMKTDANGKLYLFLPAYDGDTTAELTAGSRSYSGYYGRLSSTATYASPNVLKMGQSPLAFTHTDARTFTFGDEIVLDTEVTGGTLAGTVRYTYSGTDLSKGSTITDSATLPTNAGYYTIKATLPGNDLYYDTSAIKSFTINPKSMDGFTVQDISQQTYTGAYITPPAIVKDGTKTLLSGTDYTVIYEKNKNRGTAAAAIAGKGNYTGDLSVDFEILPKDISLTLSAAPDEAKVGSNVVLTASVLGAVDLVAGTVTFQYEDTVIAQDIPVNASGSGYSAVTTWSNVPAGEYSLTANYVAAGDDNYICVSNGLISNFSITKYDQPDFTFADGADYFLSQGTISKTFGDSAFALQTSGKLSAVAVRFAVTSGNDVVSVDAATGLVSVLKSGTAVVTATSPVDAVYNEVNTSVTIQVAKADQSGFAFTQPTISKTYGDGPFVVSAEGGQSSGSITYTVTEGNNVVTVDAVTGEVAVLRSGTAVITAIKGADDYYREAASQITINVAKTDQSVFGFAVPSVNKTYGDAPFILSASGGQSSGAVTYAVTYGSDVAMVDATSGEITLFKSGMATITATSPADDRYDMAFAQLTVHVAKANQAGFGFEEDSVNKTYGDAPFVLSASGGQSSGGVTYAVTYGSDVAMVDETSGEITLFKSGMATITATRQADDRYYMAFAQLTVHVAKANQTGFGFEEDSVNKTYGDAPFVLSASGGQSSGMITYSVTSGENIISIEAKTGKVTICNTGTAVITATSPSDDKYHEMTAQITLFVSKAHQRGFGFDEPTVNKTYGDAPFVLSASGGQSSGMITYAVTSGGNIVSVDVKTGQVTINNAGTAVITATKAGDDFYHRMTSTLSINVDKLATTVITPPAAADIPVIGALSASVLSGGVGSVPGSFSWTSPDDIVSVTGMYGVTFTPEDSMNYAASTCEVKVQVASIISDDNTGIIVDLSQATLPTGTSSVSFELSTQPLTYGDNSISNRVSHIINADPNYSGNIRAIYELKLLDQNGNQITDFTDPITVKIPIPGRLIGDLHVLWYNPEAETMTDMNAKQIDGYLVFETAHFSYYAVVQSTALPATIETVPNADTGDKTLLVTALMLLGLLTILGFVAVVRMKKKKT